MLNVRVHGIAETRKWLSRVDKEVNKELTKELRSIGNELRDEARDRIPGQAPLSNWAGTGRAMPSRFPYWESSSQAKREIKTIIGAGSKQRGTYRKGAVIRVQSNSAWGAAFDKIGDGGGTLVQNLLRKHGPKRRALLGAYDDEKDRLVDKAEESIQQAVYRAMDRWR